MNKGLTASARHLCVELRFCKQVTQNGANPRISFPIPCTTAAASYPAAAHAPPQFAGTTLLEFWFPCWLSRSPTKGLFFFLSLGNATLKLRSKCSSFAFKPSTRFLNQNFAAAVWSKANCSSLLPAASAALTAPDICFCQERKKAWLEDTRGADLLSKKVLFLQSHFTLWDTEHLHGQQGA